MEFSGFGAAQWRWDGNNTAYGSDGWRAVWAGTPIEALRSALEAAGVEFVGGPSDRPGVRLKLAGDK